MGSFHELKEVLIQNFARLHAGITPTPTHKLSNALMCFMQMETIFYLKQEKGVLRTNYMSNYLCQFQASKQEKW